MFKVKVYNKIAQVGLDQFPSELYEVSPEIQQPDAIILRSQSLHDIDIPDSVKVVGRAGAGVNNIPVAELTKLGVPVFNTPGANANAVCELVLAGMLTASRHLCDAWAYVKQLQGDDQALNEAIEANKKRFAGSELMGKTLGIVGLGSVGVRVANAAIHLGMRVIGFDPAISVNRAWELSSQVMQAHQLDDLLKAADFVSIHVPLMDATRNMIDSNRVRQMRPETVLLNFSRDGIVDNAAVKAALDNKQLAAYVSDFPCDLLKNHPSVIAFPHLGASTREAEENCAVMLVKQIRDFLEYGAILYSTNFPTVKVSPNYQGTRIAIVNANVPSMVAQVSSVLANAQINILSLVNQSRDEIAYTLLDVKGEVTVDILKVLSDIEGILQVRMFAERANRP